MLRRSGAAAQGAGEDARRPRSASAPGRCASSPAPRGPSAACRCPPAPSPATTPSASGPLHLDVTATLVDEQKVLLSGSAPLEIRVIDPLGRDPLRPLPRDRSRASASVSLPLAANDPAGKWTVTRDGAALQQGGHGVRHLTPPAQCGALAGSHAARRVLRQRLGPHLPLLPQPPGGDHRERERRL